MLYFFLFRPLFKGFLKLGKKYKNIFVDFFVQMKTLEFAYEISWPLMFVKKLKSIKAGYLNSRLSHIITTVSTIKNIPNFSWNRMLERTFKAENWPLLIHILNPVLTLELVPTRSKTPIKYSNFMFRFNTALHCMVKLWTFLELFKSCSAGIN